VQLVNLRLSAIGRLPRPSLRQPAAPSAARRKQRMVWFAETGLVACPILWRDGLAAEAALTGPAIVEAADSTILIPPGWIATVAPQGYIRLKRR
jgi:N-methylhydantoinase A